MRILYVSRLFSGLAEGIRARRWDPRGVPTVYRLLEALDRSEHDLRVVFTVKDDAVGWPETETLTFPVEGFGREITVIPQRAGLPAAFGRARGYLREPTSACRAWVKPSTLRWNIGKRRWIMRPVCEPSQ